jgi:hypothetical protein
MPFNKYGSLPINVIFEPEDVSLTSHVWKVNGVQESTSATFAKTFDKYGTYTVEHYGISASGVPCSSPYADTITLSSGQGVVFDTKMLGDVAIVGGVLAVGMIGMTWLGTNVKAK